MLSPALFQSVFDRSPVGEYLLSPSDDPVILAVNDTFLRASRRTRDSLVGQRLFAAFPDNPEDPGQSVVAQLRASFARVIATGQPDVLSLQRYPIPVRRPDGTEGFEERFWRAMSTPIHDADGTLVCIAHRTEDVTEQTRVSEALQRSNDRQMFQLALSDRLRPLTSPVAIATTASAMLGAWLRITRVTYVEVDDASGTFVQRHWVSTGIPDAANVPDTTRRLEDFGPGIIQLLRSGQVLCIRDVHEDPRTRAHAAAYDAIDVRSNVAIPLVKAGRLTTVLSLQHHCPRDWSEDDIALGLDVAERTWLAAENARAQEELHEANRRKDEFLAMLAHELRNPLAPVSMAAELLARHELEPARVRRTSEVIARQVRHMTGLVDDLLDVSRVTRGLVTIEPAPQDMNAVVASAVEQARPLVESQRHQLTLALSRGPAPVSGDGKRLVQVVSNLLNNAAKYTPAGGHIEVGVEAAGATVRVHVKDDGIGIPQALQPHIFELFAQAERTPDRSQGGLGLGLALVRSLVELHGGTVTCTSAGVGQGSCFTVTLPALAASEAPQAAPGDAAAGGGTAPLDVLVVDDNTDAAGMLQLLLEDRGHRVRVEHDPVPALEAATASPPDAALIDIGLPGMDGYELVRRLRATPATASGLYVAVTGYGQEADRALALAAGFDEHLVKPIDAQRLLEVLATAKSG